MSDYNDLPGFKDFISKASTDDVETLLQKMRDEGLDPVTSFFATIHHKSDRRPDGFSEDDLNDIHDKLHSADKERWQNELQAHLARKKAGF